MKLNWAERWVVNNPLRAIEQRFQVRRLKGMRPLGQGSTALEVGCGRGAGAKLILKEFRPAQLHALDLDIRMVRMARRYLSSGERGRVRLYVGDVYRLPFKDGSLDAVFGFGVLHHVPDWRHALSEIARVLKTGGVYFLEELYPSLYQNAITRRILLHPEEDRFYSHELRDAMSRAGMPVQDALDLRRLGILGVAVKAAG